MAQESAPQPLTLQLVRFEYRHIYSIDQLAQTFSARVFILLQIPAKEVEARKETEFPLGDTDDGDEDKATGRLKNQEHIIDNSSDRNPNHHNYRNIKQCARSSVAG